MKPTKLFSQSLSSIWHNKARSTLTILGIVIGIASVIALVALGNGLEESTLDRFSSLGAERITISSQDPSNAEEEEAESSQGAGGTMRALFSGSSSSDPSLTEEDYATTLGFENIVAASPQVSIQQLTASTAQDDISVTLTGVDVSYSSMEKLVVAQGEFISAEHVAASERVVVISDGAKEDLFEVDPIGQTITVDNFDYKVVGVLEAADEEGFGFMRSAGETLYIPYTTALDVSEQELIPTIVADGADEELVPETAQGLIEAIYVNHEVTEDDADVSITIAQDTIEAISSVQSSFSGTLTGIAAISLIVGGIGIMNIMLVTVTERTREIGLRRAVGAKKHHIALQFLTEAVMLTFIGGVIGLLTGIAFSTKAGSIISVSRGPSSSDITAVVDPQTIILALTISIAVGVLFGLFPAIKAANKDPVEALRYE